MQIPVEIEDKMKAWRLGFDSLPQEYIDWHKDQALANLPDDKYIIHVQRMSRDGWLDGMQFIELIVEDRRSGEVDKLRWSDSCRWYRQCRGGGWVIDNLRD